MQLSFICINVIEPSFMSQHLWDHKIAFRDTAVAGGQYRQFKMVMFNWSFNYLVMLSENLINLHFIVNNHIRLIVIMSQIKPKSIP